MRHHESYQGFNSTNSIIHLEQYLEDNLSKSKVLTVDSIDNNSKAIGGGGGVSGALKHEHIPAMVRLGIDRGSLSNLGMDKVTQDTLYRSLFVYSHGAQNIITEYSKYADSKLPGKLWNALLHLVDSCDPGNTQLISSEIKGIYTDKFNELMDFHQKVVEIGEIQIGKLSASEALSKLKYMEILNSTHLDNIALESIQRKQRYQIESTKTMYETAMKHRDEMKDLYMEAQLKLFDRDKEIDRLVKANEKLTQSCSDYAVEVGLLKKTTFDATTNLKVNEEKMRLIAEERSKMIETVQQCIEVRDKGQNIMDNWENERGTLQSQIDTYEAAKQLLIIDRKKSMDLLTSCFNIITNLTSSLSEFQNGVINCNGQLRSYKGLKDIVLANRISKISVESTDGEGFSLALNSIDGEQFSNTFSKASSQTSIADHFPIQSIDLKTTLLNLDRLNKKTDLYLRRKVEAPPRKAKSHKNHDKNSDSNISNDEDEVRIGSRPTLGPGPGPEPPVEESKADPAFSDQLDSTFYQSISTELANAVDQLLRFIPSAESREANLLKDLQVHCDSFTTADYFKLLQIKRESQIRIDDLEGLNAIYVVQIDQIRNRLAASESRAIDLQNTVNEKDLAINSVEKDLQIAQALLEELKSVNEVNTAYKEEIDSMTKTIAHFEEMKRSNEESILDLMSKLNDNMTKIEEDGKTITLLKGDLASMTDMYARKVKFEEMYTDISYNWHTIMEVLWQVLKLSKKSWANFFAGLKSKVNDHHEGSGLGFQGDTCVDKEYLSYKGTDIFELLSNTTLSEPDRHCILDLSNLSAKSMQFIDNFDELNKQLIHQREITANSIRDIGKLNLHYAKDKVVAFKLVEKNKEMQREINDLKLKMAEIEVESQEMRSLANKYSGEISSLNKRLKLVQQRNQFATEKDSRNSSASAPAPMSVVASKGPTIDKQAIVRAIDSISVAEKSALSIITKRLDYLNSRIDNLVILTDSIDLDQSINAAAAKIAGKSLCDGISLHEGEGSADGYCDSNTPNMDPNTRGVSRRAMKLTMSAASNSRKNSAKDEKYESIAIFNPSNLLNVSFSDSDDENSITDEIDIKNDEEKDKPPHSPSGVSTGGTFSAENNQAVPKIGEKSTYSGIMDCKETPEKFLGMPVKFKTDQVKTFLDNSTSDAASKLNNDENNEKVKESSPNDAKLKSANIVRKAVATSPAKERQDPNADLQIRAKHMNIEIGASIIISKENSLANAAKVFPVNKQFSNIVFDNESSASLSTPKPARSMNTTIRRETTVGSLLGAQLKEIKEKDAPIIIVEAPKSNDPYCHTSIPNPNPNSNLVPLPVVDIPQIKVIYGLNHTALTAQGLPMSIPQIAGSKTKEEEEEEEDNNGSDSDNGDSGEIDKSIINSNTTTTNNNNKSNDKDLQTGGRKSENILKEETEETGEIVTESSLDNAAESIVEVAVPVVRAPIDPKAWREKKATFMQGMGGKYASELNYMDTGTSTNMASMCESKFGMSPLQKRRLSVKKEDVSENVGLVNEV